MLALLIILVLPLLVWKIDQIEPMKDWNWLDNNKTADKRDNK